MTTIQQNVKGVGQLCYLIGNENFAGIKFRLIVLIFMHIDYFLNQYFSSDVKSTNTRLLSFRKC